MDPYVYVAFWGPNERPRLRGHTDVVISCDVSADGAWIATGGLLLSFLLPKAM